MKWVGVSCVGSRGVATGIAAGSAIGTRGTAPPLSTGVATGETTVGCDTSKVGIAGSVIRTGTVAGTGAKTVSVPTTAGNASPLTAMNLGTMSPPGGLSVVVLLVVAAL